MAAVDTPRRTYLPQSRRLIDRALTDSGVLDGFDRTRLTLFERLLASHLHFRYHDRLERLKRLYAPFDSEFDPTLDIAASAREAPDRDAMVEAFAATAVQGNYFELSGEDLAFALDHRSLFRINLEVNLDRYEVVRVFARGEATTTERMRKGILFRKRDVDVPCYRRVALAIVPPAEAPDGDTPPAPGERPVVLKLFSMVPKADLEMLFPDIDISMTTTDRLLLAAGFVGGAIGVVVKAGAGLVAMGAVLWFMLRRSLAHGTFPPLSPAEITAMVGGMSALVAIGAFLYKQWSNYRNRRIQFMHKLANNLYFRSLDNNAGVLTRLIDEAEDEDFKEAWLAWLFLARQGPMTEDRLDTAIEAWFEKHFDVRVDFDCADALEKLEAFGILERGPTPEGGDSKLSVPDLDAACAKLDALWDDYYQVDAEGQIAGDAFPTEDERR